MLFPVRPSQPSPPHSTEPVALHQPLALPPPATPPPTLAQVLRPQVVMFAAGVAGLFGVFESAAPLIELASHVDPRLVFPARAGAAAAIGCGGATAVVLMDSAYHTVSMALVRSLDSKTTLAAELHFEKTNADRYQLPREIVAGCIAAGTVGAVLGGLIAFFPKGVMYTLAGAVGLSLAYCTGNTILHTTRAIRDLRRSRATAAQNSPEAASKHRSAYRHSVQKAGAFALESVTIAAVTQHMIAEVHHLIADPDHHNGAKVVASAAEQLPGALESVAEVAEAMSIGARGAREAAVAARTARSVMHSRNL